MGTARRQMPARAILGPTRTVAAGLSLLVAATLLPAQLRADDRLIDVPVGIGMTLGQGWNVSTIRPTAGSCIVFLKGASDPDEGQITDMSLKEVSSSYQMQRAIGVDAATQYKGLAVEVAGKASYAKQIDVDGSATNITVYGTIYHDNQFVAPPGEHADNVVALVQSGRWSYDNPEENLALLATDAETVGRRTRLAAGLPQTSGKPDLRGLIRLMPQYAELAEKDPVRFRKVCGDAYVKSIVRGGELAAVFTFKTRSLAQQQSITATMTGKGWGVTASGSLKSAVETAAKTAQYTMRWFQLGGSGDNFSPEPEKFYDAVGQFPKQVDERPRTFKLRLGQYGDLPNWPDDKPDSQSGFAAMDRLANLYSAWLGLSRDTKAVLDATDDRLARNQGFLLGRGVSRQSLLELQSMAQQRAEDAKRLIHTCGGAPSTDAPCDPVALEPKVEAAAPLDEALRLRAKLPPVVEDTARQAERFLPAEELRDRVYHFWLKRNNESRCAVSDDPSRCWTEQRLESLRGEIPVTSDPIVTIVSLLGNKDHCANVNTKTWRVNYSTPCRLRDDKQRFVYSLKNRTLKHVQSGRCMNVRGASKKSGSDVIVTGCSSNANFRWKHQAGGSGGWLLIAEHSGQCLNVPDPIKTGRRLVQSECRKDGKGKLVGWQRQNWLMVAQ